MRRTGILAIATAVWASAQNEGCARTAAPAVPCEQFSKLADGSWKGGSRAIVTISGSHLDISGAIVRPASPSINGQNLFLLIERTCARRRTNGDRK